MVDMPHTPVATLTVRLGVLGTALQSRYGEVLAGLGLKPKHVTLLSALRMGGAESQQQLAAGLQIAPSLVVLLADQLAALGAISRVRDPADRRRQHLHLTDAGDRLLDQATALAVALEDECVAPLCAADRAALIRILDTLAVNGGL